MSSYSSRSRFLGVLRELWRRGVALEPRDESWFEGGADRLLARYRVARVAADPHQQPEGADPGGRSRLVYFRLHGSPRTYYSAYSNGYLDELSRRIGELPRSTTVWCLFNNTAAGAAVGNALGLWNRLRA